MDFIPQMEPWFDENEAQALSDYIKGGGWVTEFQKTRNFEILIRDFIGSKYCSVVSNGTVSLTLALIACGIGIGDEVIVPDYTMVATPNSVKLAGSEVVFVDINPINLCMDFERMKDAVTERTKAIILVTINGRYPDNLNEYIEYCHNNGLLCIEDAAQSLGSYMNNRHLGTFGDIGSFSFSAPKIITTGQGGALVTDNELFFDRILKLRDFGRERGGIDHYLSMGWNFKFTDVQAIIGIEQMKKLPWRIKRKKEIYSLYKNYLEKVENISFIHTNLNDTSPWFIDILIKEGKRDILIDYLKKRGIGSRPFYPPLHSEPVYNRNENHPISELISKQGLWLPSSCKLSNDNIEFICKEIIKYFTTIN